jgi:hypothetical protein
MLKIAKITMAGVALTLFLGVTKAKADLKFIGRSVDAIAEELGKPPTARIGAEFIWSYGRGEAFRCKFDGEGLCQSVSVITNTLVSDEKVLTILGVEFGPDDTWKETTSDSVHYWRDGANNSALAGFDGKTNQYYLTVSSSRYAVNNQASVSSLSAATAGNSVPPPKRPSDEAASVAMNLLQDALGRPRVKGGVRYDAATDTYNWIGPKFGEL